MFQKMKKRRPIGWPRVPVRETTMLNSSWIIRIGHPRYCSRSPVCSITSELSSETTLRPDQAPARCPSTASCGGRSGRRRSSWAISRMTTRSTMGHLCLCKRKIPLPRKREGRQLHHRHVEGRPFHLCGLDPLSKFINSVFLPKLAALFFLAENFDCSLCIPNLLFRPGAVPIL